LEWTALITGYQSLIAVAAVLYLAAFLLATRWRFLADRGLAVAGVRAAPGAQSRGRLRWWSVSRW